MTKTKKTLDLDNTTNSIPGAIQLDPAPAIPSRYSKICMACPAWLSCKDHEGLAHTCPECFKSFFLNTQKQGMQRRHTEYGSILPDSWRFILGIPEECPLLTDEFIRYEHPCLECMKKAGIKVE